MIQKLKQFVGYGFAILALLLSFNFIVPALASASITCPDGSSADKAADCTCTLGTESSCTQNQDNADCVANSSKQDTTISTCTDPAASQTSVCTATNCNLINNYVDPLIQLLSAAVGLAVTISIIIGGIQYSSSAGDPARVSAAKNRIRNSIIALVAFIFLYAFLQFLVPGGIFRK